MNILNTIIDKFGGGIVKEGFEIVKAYFPPSMTDQEKEAAKFALEKFVFEKQKEANESSLRVQQDFNQRIKDMEGTANDLKAWPKIGSVIMLLRGTLRPFWGWFCAYADVMVFSGAWVLDQPEYKRTLFALNILVFVFIFGERAVKTVMPLIVPLVKEVWGKRGSK